MLRIMIIGYYGHSNAGDELLQQAMTYIFRDHKITFCSWLPSILAMNECDLIVVGGGSIWPGFPIFQHADEISRRLNVPIFVMGISAKKHDNLTLQKTVQLIEKSSFFHVRDKATANEFENHPKVRSGVDLFWWMPWSPVEPVNYGNESKAVAINLREWSTYSWDPINIIETIQSFGFELKGLPFYFGSIAHDQNITQDDVQLLKSLNVKNVPTQFSYQPISESKFTVAMRFHAVLLSTRMEKPVISFNYHPKISNFYLENNIPELCVNLDKPKELEVAITLLENNYMEYVSKFIEIRERLEKSAAKDYESFGERLSLIHKQKPLSFLKRVIRRFI